MVVYLNSQAQTKIILDVVNLKNSAYHFKPFSLQRWDKINDQNCDDTEPLFCKQARQYFVEAVNQTKNWKIFFLEK